MIEDVVFFGELKVQFVVFVCNCGCKTMARYEVSGNLLYLLVDSRCKLAVCL